MTPRSVFSVKYNHLCCLVHNVCVLSFRSLCLPFFLPFLCVTHHFEVLSLPVGLFLVFVPQTGKDSLQLHHRCKWKLLFVTGMIREFRHRKLKKFQTDVTLAFLLSAFHRKKFISFLLFLSSFQMQALHSSENPRINLN